MISYCIEKSINEDKWELQSLVDTNYNGIAKNFVFEGTYEECQEKMKQLKALDRLAKQAQELDLE